MGPLTSYLLKEAGPSGATKLKALYEAGKITDYDMARLFAPVHGRYFKPEWDDVVQLKQALNRYVARDAAEADCLRLS
jgi:hypothetical protein